MKKKLEWVVEREREKSGRSILILDLLMWRVRAKPILRYKRRSGGLTVRVDVNCG